MLVPFVIVFLIIALLSLAYCVIATGNDIMDLSNRLIEAVHDRDNAERTLKEIRESGFFDQKTHGPSCPWFEKKDSGGT